MVLFDLFGSQKKEIISKEIKQKEIYEAINKEYIESGYIKTELLPELTEKVKRSVCSIEYSEIGFSALFSCDDLLTLEEKKALKLPTRQKISREMINNLSEEGKKLTDPKGTLQEIYSYHYNTISRKYELLVMKNQLKYDSDIRYRFIACLDEATCIICGALDGILLKSPSDVDIFEKHKCQNKYCRCIFTPVQRGFGDPSGQTYAGWFRKLSVIDKKEILGEYYNRYKDGESLKDIAFSLTEETALKYHQDRKARVELRETEEAKKKTKRTILPPLTEEQLLEIREFYIKQAEGMSNVWTLEEKQDWINRCVENIKTKTRKDQHQILEYALNKDNAKK